MIRYILSIILSLIISQSGFCDIRYRQLRTSDGLPGNTVRSIIQDSHGFLWIATLNGLSRWDGNRFVNFTSTIEPLLKDSRIYNVTEDNNNFIWIGTSSRLFSCYDLQRGEFVEYGEDGGGIYSHIKVTSGSNVWLWHEGNGVRMVSHDEKRKLKSILFTSQKGNLIDNRVTCLHEKKDGTILIGTRSGVTAVGKEKKDQSVSFLTGVDVKSIMEESGRIYVVSLEGKLFELKGSHISEICRIGDGLIVSDCFLTDGKLFVLTNSGSYRYDLKKGGIVREPSLPESKGKVMYDNNRRPWIYDRTGTITYYLEEDKTFKSLDLIPQHILSHIDYERFNVIEDNAGLIWISTYGNGLFIFNRDGKIVAHYTSEDGYKSPVKSNYIRFMTSDCDGGIWIASEYSGVTRMWIDSCNPEYRYLDERQAMDRGNAVRMLSKVSDGRIYVSSRNGKLYSFEEEDKTMCELPDVGSSVYCVMRDDNGEEWVGTRGGGLMVNGIRYRADKENKSSLPNDNVYFIHKDKKGRKWIGTFGGGLGMCVKDESGIIRFRRFFEGLHGIDQQRCITEDGDGRLWIGTSSGLISFLPDSLIKNENDYILYSHNSGNFSGNEVRYLLRDSKGYLWVATSDSGLVKCFTDKVGNLIKYEQFTVDDGLANNSIQSIVEDMSGDIWVGTEYGLSRYDSRIGDMESYILSKDFLQNVYGEGCAVMTQSGELMFGTNYGIVTVDPAKVKRTTINRIPMFTNILVNGQQVSRKDKDSPLECAIDYADTIRLKYYQNSVAIDFSVFDFSDKSNGCRYVYRLDNYDKEWSRQTSLSTVSYKYLPPGKYTLHVRQTGGDNKREATLLIMVMPPWWKTWWAYLCYIGLIGTVILVAFRYFKKINSLRNRITVERELAEYKLRFFTNISHEFRTPLTLIQCSLEKLRRSNREEREDEHSITMIEHNSLRMSRLVNQLLEFRKSEAEALNLTVEQTDVAEFISNLVDLFRDEAERCDVTLSFVSTTSSLRIFVDRNYLDQIGYNLLSNALKYTPAGGMVTVIVSENENYVVVSVMDTGIGVTEEQEKNLFRRYVKGNFSRDSIGIGLSLSHALAQKHHGSLCYSANRGGGSVFTLSLPKDSNLYTKDEMLISSHVEEETSLRTSSSVRREETVLIVEDNVELLGFLSEEVGKYYNVVAVSDGEAGLEKAHERSIDVIISDVMMPRLDGIELTRRIKNNIATSHIPVVLLTALSDNDNKLCGIDAGADDYISKPFSPRLLLARLHALLRNRELLRKKYSSDPEASLTEVCKTNPDREFMERINGIIEENIGNHEFTMDDFASRLGLSRALFFRKLKSITGTSPNEYLKMIRLRRGAELLRDGSLNVAEVADRVGFKDPFYFSKCFKSQFKESPTNYKKEKSDV